MSDELEINQAEPHNEVQAQEPEKKAESDIEYNVRMLREKALQAERRTKELENYISNLENQKKVERPHEDFDISDDEYIEGKHLKKYISNIKNELKETRRQFEEFSQQNSVNTAEMRLKSQFNDFESVVNSKSLERLAGSNPTLYKSILASPDIYERGQAAYEILKVLGLNKFEKAEEKIQENKYKPRSSSTAQPQAPESPLTRAGEYDRRVLSEEYKQELRNRLAEIKKR